MFRLQLCGGPIHSENAVSRESGKREGNPWHEIDRSIQQLLDLPRAFKPNGGVAVTSFHLLECVSMLIGGRLQAFRRRNLSQADIEKRTGLIRTYLSQSKVWVR